MILEKSETLQITIRDIKTVFYLYEVLPPRAAKQVIGPRIPRSWLEHLDDETWDVVDIDDIDSWVSHDLLTTSTSVEPVSESDQPSTGNLCSQFFCFGNELAYAASVLAPVEFFVQLNSCIFGPGWNFFLLQFLRARFERRETRAVLWCHDVVIDGTGECCYSGHVSGMTRSIQCVVEVDRAFFQNLFIGVATCGIVRRTTFST